MELDPLYYDVIVQRWETFAGQRVRRHSLHGADNVVELAR